MAICMGLYSMNYSVDKNIVQSIRNLFCALGADSKSGILSDKVSSAFCPDFSASIRPVLYGELIELLYLQLELVIEDELYYRNAKFKVNNN